MRHNQKPETDLLLIQDLIPESGSIQLGIDLASSSAAITAGRRSGPIGKGGRSLRVQYARGVGARGTFFGGSAGGFCEGEEGWVDV